MTSRIFISLMQHDPRVREMVSDIVPEVFPWVAFLSRDEVREFVVELVSTMRAADSIDNPAAVIQLIDSWRHTAEVPADPELAAVLTQPSMDDHVWLPGVAIASHPRRGEWQDEVTSGGRIWYVVDSEHRRPPPSWANSGATTPDRAAVIATMALYAGPTPTIVVIL